MIKTLENMYEGLEVVITGEQSPPHPPPDGYGIEVKLMRHSASL
jgi:hypothetical protein